MTKGSYLSTINGHKKTTSTYTMTKKDRKPNNLQKKGHCGETFAFVLCIKLHFCNTLFDI